MQVSMLLFGMLARQAVRVAEGHSGDEAEELEVQLLRPGQFFQAIREGAVALLPTATTIALALATGLLADAAGGPPPRREPPPGHRASPPFLGHLTPPPRAAPTR